MKELTVILFLLFLSVSGFSQNDSEKTKIAILKSKIAQSENAEKLKWMDSLGQYLNHNTRQNPDSIFRVSIEYALQLDSLNYAGARLADLMDNLNNVEGKPEDALKEFLKHKYFFKKIDDAKILAKIYLNAGDSYYYLKNYKISIQYYDSTQVFAKKGNAKRLLALAVMYKGATLGDQGNFAQASKDLQEASKVFSEIKDTSNIISVKNSLSILYSQNAFYKEALVERNDIIILAKKLKSYAQLVSFYFNASTDAKKTGKAKLRIENLEQSYDYSKKSKHNEFYEPLILSELVSAYSENGSIKEAEKYLAALKSKPQNIQENNREHYLEALKNLAFAEGDYKNALKYGKEHLRIKQKNTNYEDIINAEKFISVVYEKLGNSKQALQHFQNYTSLKDSIINVQNVKALTYYQTIYETEKRNLKIKAQQGDIELLDSKNSQKNQWMLFGGLGLVAIFGFVILIRSRNFAKKKQKLQEGFSQDLIKGQEEERARVARELHDSVGQKLMLLSKKTKATGNLEMESLAGNTLEELRSISRGLHPSILEKLGITAAIKSMINEVDSNTNIFFTQEIENIDNMISKEASLHLYRIVQELLNNMVKHAEAKSASVTIEKKNNTIEATIRDNGKGFEYSEKLKSSASLGMKTLMERAKILHSKIDIKSQLNKGTTIALIIPT